MINQLKHLGLFLIICIAACQPSQAPVGEVDFPEGSVQHVVRSDQIQWKPCPPHLPPGCELIVLDGSPQEADMFTVRFRMSPDFVMPPHTHPRDERVTVIAGKVSVAFGPNASRDQAKQFGPGDYYINARDAIHTVWSDTVSIVQITGMGPWEAHFVEE